MKIKFGRELKRSRTDFSPLLWSTVVSRDRDAVAYPGFWLGGGFTVLGGVFGGVTVPDFFHFFLIFPLYSYPLGGVHVTREPPPKYATVGMPGESTLRLIGVVLLVR